MGIFYHVSGAEELCQQRLAGLVRETRERLKQLSAEIECSSFGEPSFDIELQRSMAMTLADLLRVQAVLAERAKAYAEIVIR